MLHLVDAPLLLCNLFSFHLGTPLEECLLIPLRRLLTLLSLLYCLLVLFTDAPSPDHLLEQVFSLGIDQFVYAVLILRFDLHFSISILSNDLLLRLFLPLLSLILLLCLHQLDITKSLLIFALSFQFGHNGPLFLLLGLK